MPRTTKTRGFILKKRNLLNKDIVFTIFSVETGKMSVFAKGIRSITSRRAPHIQTGNLVELELNHRGDTSYLQNSKLVSAFSQIRETEKMTNFLYLFLFILDKILPENQQEPKMYQVTQGFLFDMARNPAFSTQQFTVHLNSLLSVAGYVQGQKSLSELVRTVEETINEKVPVLVS
jgi:DNA repair protein RecO